MPANANCQTQPLLSTEAKFLLLNRVVPPPAQNLLPCPHLTRSCVYCSGEGLVRRLCCLLRRSARHVLSTLLDPAIGFLPPARSAAAAFTACPRALSSLGSCTRVPFPPHARPLSPLSRPFSSARPWCLGSPGAPSWAFLLTGAFLWEMATVPVAADILMPWLPNRCL